MNEPFVEIDHSGDIGIEARGGNMAELIENATRGLFALMYRGRVNASVKRKVRIDSHTREDLLVDWLSEVIAMSGAHGELYGAVSVEKSGDYFAEGTLGGERVDPVRHDLRFDVKAATYHGLSVEEGPGGFRARVIYDL